LPISSIGCGFFVRWGARWVKTVWVARTLAILDVGVLAAFGMHALRLGIKRRRLERITRPERSLYQVLAVVSLGAILSLLIGDSIVGMLPR